MSPRVTTPAAACAPPIPEVQDWTGCYGNRGDLFTKVSYRHPAKMGVALTYRIFEHGARRGYWQPGDLILDPMGGIGTTAIVGASLGYRVAMIELERHRAMLREELGAQHTLDGGEVEIVRERKSFFKRLHEKRNPGLRVDHEDVLFFRKREGT